MIAQMCGNGVPILLKLFHVSILFLCSGCVVNVSPDDFFVGIGDINSTFLPRLDASTSANTPMSPPTSDRQSNVISGPTLLPSVPVPAHNGSQSGILGTPPTDEAVSEEILQKEMMARNSLALEAQVEERPLAKLQEELQEAADGELTSESPASTSASGKSESASNPHESPGEKHHRKALLKNDDTELQRVKHVSRIFL
jgi:RNA polymerase II subunit A C-terminal domain phosphatase